MYTLRLTTLYPLRAEPWFRFVPAFQRKSFYRSERVSLLHTLFRNLGEKFESLLAVTPGNCNSNDLQPREGSNYGEDVVDTIRARPIEFKHLDRLK